MPKAYAHRTIRDTAVAMAHELYDTMMTDNVWHKAWKSANPDAGAKALESRFVNKNLPRLLPFARATLGQMLGNPTTPEVLKNQIYEALLGDNILTYGRKRAPTMPREMS